MKIAFSTNHPNPVIYGGFEVQAWRTYSELRSAGLQIELLEWHTKSQSFDVLHLFGWSPVWWDVSEHWFGRGKLVLSMVGGFQRRTRMGAVLTSIKRGIRRQLNVSDSWSKNQLLLLMRADQIICLSRFEAEVLENEYRVPAERISIIPNGVDPVFGSVSMSEFRQKYAISNYVLFVGSISRRKNPLALLRCLKSLGVPGVFIGIPAGGESDYVAEFEREFSGLKDQIWIRGLDSGSSLLASAYAGARAFCLPSLSETQPISALEAVASGIPVILGNGAYSEADVYQGCLRVNPLSGGSLEHGVARALAGGTGIVDRKKILTWSEVAKSVSEVYEKI